MDPTLVIAGLWLIFAGTHVVLSSAAVRPRLIARLGAQAFQGVYSLAVLLPFVALVWFFHAHKHTGPLLWTTIGPPQVARGAAWLLNVTAFVLLVCSLVPSAAAPSSLGAADPHPRAHGMLRVTRHPLLAAFASWGLAHLLVNGHVGDVVYFGGYPLWVWIGARHQDARLSRDRPGYAEFVRETSLVPFAAILAGRQRLALRELPWTWIAVGIAAALAVRHWHGALFGP